jgi:hypothetical protein
MPSILKDLLEINLSDYENISFNLEINKVVIGAFVALIVGVIVLNVYRGNIRLVVMQLMRHSATSEENAKTIKELGLAGAKGVKTVLSKRNPLTRITARSGEIEYDYETYVKMDKYERKLIEKIDFDEARFYIKEEEKHRAQFIIERYNTSVIRTAMECVFVAIIGCCIFLSMPGILNVINNLFGKL